MQMNECDLMPKDVPKGACHWCLGALVGRQRRWCSKLCAGMFWTLHDWKSARKETIRRDGGICQRCGIATISLLDPRWTIHPEAPWYPLWDPERFKFEGESYRTEHWAAVRQYNDESKKFMLRVALPVAPEVNHRDPRVGRGYKFGCWNHLEPDADGIGGLETVCHRCHVQITAVQRSSRKSAT